MVSFPNSNRDKNKLNNIVRNSFLFLLLFFVHFSFAQNISKIDSFEINLWKFANTENEVEQLLKFSYELESFDTSKVLIYTLRAYNVSKNIDYKLGEVNTLLRISKYYLNNRNFEKAIEYAENSKELAKKLKMLKEIGYANSQISVIYYEIGDYKKSSEYDFENLKYFEQIDDQQGIGIAYGNIGVDFINQKNYPKALEYLNKSLYIAQKINDSSGISYQYNSIASLYFEHFKDYKKARYYYNEALKVNILLHDKYQIAINFMNLGSVYLELDEMDSAHMYYQKALQDFSELHFPLLIAECQLGLGEYYFKLNDLNKSVQYADSTLFSGKLFDSKELQLEAAKLLHKNYLLQKDSASAYKYAMIENQIKDSLFLFQNQKDLFLLEFQYNNIKIEKQRQIEQQKKNFVISIIILCMVFIIIIILLILLHFKTKAKNAILEKEKTESILDFKKKELANNLLALIQKNEMMVDISKKLIGLEKEAANDDTKDAIGKLSKQIVQSVKNKKWTEISKQFQEVHAQFYEKLLVKFPELTQNELKLCAFLRLNMTTKDISELTGQQLTSIDQARYRLRKKLEISNSETNLVVFLSQI